MISKVKDKTVYQSLVDTSTKLFELLTKNLDVNSAYIAKKVGNKMTVINSYNKVEFIIPDDIAVDYQESNCKLVLENNEPVKTVMNLMANEETKKRKITDELGVKAFIGVPLNRTDGSNFGTLCLMDKDEKTLPMNKWKWSSPLPMSSPILLNSMTFMKILIYSAYPLFRYQKGLLSWHYKATSTIKGKEKFLKIH